VSQRAGRPAEPRGPRSPTANTVDLDRRLPNSELVIYPDAGHGGIFQNHREFVETTLGFLDR
jgi:pimeloyl-ACP methyl ester carboxylesterase